MSLTTLVHKCETQEHGGIWKLPVLCRFTLRILFDRQIKLKESEDSVT